MSTFIDTHCHLDLFKGIQNNSKQEDDLGIKTITVTNAPSFFGPNSKLFGDSLNIRVALGLHPQLIDQFKGELVLFQQLIKKTRYIGEIGLDGSSDLKKTYKLQKETFEKVLLSVRDNGNKVLTIHSRNAANETIEFLSKYLYNTDNKVILHWYSGTIDDLKKAVLRGFYFSINHNMVISEKGKEIISYIPENLILTETDAPFTFSPTINTRLKSLSSTIEGIAIRKNKSSEEIKSIVYNNFKNLLSTST
ncbi:Qat anti-phage system TatD family nuclease QatD [Emticicia sp. 17c]|uniref:Qat anti-phage system TatD family nuclease QatD n=1 Tax=Emticicia sp. 17c TaxID=3127704 RepID=UPI00301D54C7